MSELTYFVSLCVSSIFLLSLCHRKWVRLRTLISTSNISHPEPSKNVTGILISVSRLLDLFAIRSVDNMHQRHLLDPILFFFLPFKDLMLHNRKGFFIYKLIFLQTNLWIKFLQWNIFFQCLSEFVMTVWI